jgi:hypothetical protein
MTSIGSTNNSSSSAAATSALASTEVAIGARQGTRAVLGEEGESMSSAMVAPFVGLQLNEKHGCQRMGSSSGGNKSESDNNRAWGGDGKAEDDSVEMR